jgi:hypothetical protein
VKVAVLPVLTVKTAVRVIVAAAAVMALPVVALHFCNNISTRLVVLVVLAIVHGSNRCTLIDNSICISTVVVNAAEVAAVVSVPECEELPSQPLLVAGAATVQQLPRKQRLVS